MLTAQQIKDKLSTDDVKKLMNLLGGELWEENDQELIYDTICHSGHSHKLYFYLESKLFVCYSECGNLDIFQLVMKVKDYSFPEALNWVTTQCGMSTQYTGFGNFELIDDWEFISKIKSRRSRKEKSKKNEIKVYDESILNIFEKNTFPKEWLDEGISIQSMQKYEIMHHTLQHQIVIVHRNIDGELIGVRVRNTLDERCEEHGKYIPFMLDKNSWAHSLGSNLYGIHKNSDIIRANRKVLLVEGEKSVLKCETYFPNNNFSLALCGHNLTSQQIELIRNMGVREVIIGLDKQWESVGDKDWEKWNKHIKEKIIDRLLPYVVVSVLYDEEGLLQFKDSPMDRGKDILLHLMNKKLYV